MEIIRSEELNAKTEQLTFQLNEANTALTEGRIAHERAVKEIIEQQITHPPAATGPHLNSHNTQQGDVTRVRCWKCGLKNADVCIGCYESKDTDAAAEPDRESLSVKYQQARDEHQDNENRWRQREAEMIEEIEK